MSDSLPSASIDPWRPFLDAIVDGMAVAQAQCGLAATKEAVLGQLSLEEGPEGEVSLPSHRLAQAAKKPPAELASALAAAFPASPLLRQVSSKGAYVNFRVDPVALARGTLDLVLARGNRYGHSEPAGPPVVVEHTSANPTGPFHIGRVRNGIIGDTFARVLRAAGAPVTTQYYVDDMGRQTAMITWIWSKPRDEWPEPIRRAMEGEGGPDEKPDRHWGRPYPAVSAFLKENEEAREQVAQLVQQIESGEVPADHRARAQAILDGMLQSLGRLRIGFDEFVWESDFVRDGSVDRVIARLRACRTAVEQANGAWAIDASSHGLPKESTLLVFQRANGTSLYLTRDIAYHLTKFARFARVIDVLGQDHQLHARSLDALLEEIGEARRPSYVIYQDITVPEGGRMSTRGGSAVWLDQLLSEAVDRARAEVLARREDLADADIERIAESVATGAIRYHIVRAAPDKPVVFRWEDALSFEGRSGPFLQYSYARASSVLRKGEATQPPYLYDPERLSHPEEAALIRILSRFPRTIAYAARTGHVHSVAGYAHELADQFNRFYHAVPVLRSGDERASRIALVAAVRQTLGNALDLLGIVALDAM